MPDGLDECGHQCSWRNACLSKGRLKVVGTCKACCEHLTHVVTHLQGTIARTRSGFCRSSMAVPSARNSGLHEAGHQSEFAQYQVDAAERCVLTEIHQSAFNSLRHSLGQDVEPDILVRTVPPQHLCSHGHITGMLYRRPAPSTTRATASHGSRAVSPPSRLPLPSSRAQWTSPPQSCWMWRLTRSCVQHPP